MEFALVLPLFMMLVMGALDYGYYFFSDQVVTNAAREGARAGTLVNPGGTPATNDAAAEDAAKNAAKDYMTSNGVSCPSGGFSCIFPKARTPGPGGLDTVEVKIRYDFASLTGFTSVILPKHVEAFAIMRWQ